MKEMSAKLKYLIFEMIALFCPSFLMKLKIGSNISKISYGNETKSNFFISITSGTACRTVKSYTFERATRGDVRIANNKKKKEGNPRFKNTDVEFTGIDKNTCKHVSKKFNFRDSSKRISKNPSIFHGATVDP